MNELITILGPTATGKTGLAAALSEKIGGEIISADSRQVYRSMDLGTGKDLDDYLVNGVQIPYHLIDIADPGEEYNVFRFQQDFLIALQDIQKRGKKAIMCGGTGMYLESVILAYEMQNTRENKKLRKELEALSTESLIERLRSHKELHNVTDTTERERLIRAIEISELRTSHSELRSDFPKINHHVFGVSLPREEIRKKITFRLQQRLKDGMVEEVQRLLDSGITAEQLEFYGLEYKFLTQYARGQILEGEMFRLLNTAIHQFAKRQMTWFRRMEKKGVTIIWIDGNMSMHEKVNEMMDHLRI